MELHDIVIVGASAAGLACSLETSFKTIIIDKKKEIGKPIVCGEYVPLPFINYAMVPSDAIAKKVEGMITYLDGEERFKRWPGAIINRDLWERALYEKARDKGVEFWLNTKVIELNGDIILFERDRERSKIRAKFIIGADGPLSVIGKGIKSQNQKFIYGYQYRIPLRKNLENTLIYLDKRLKCGYGWLFPKGEAANLGIGVEGTKEPWRLLDHLLDRLCKEGKVEKEILDRVAGLIPVGGILEPLSSQNKVLVGDAGGFTNPITGAGVYQAFWTGRLAAEAANSYITGDHQAAKGYEEEARRFWGLTVQRAKKKRDLLENGWEGNFKTLIKRTWPAFDEYYKDKIAL